MTRGESDSDLFRRAVSNVKKLAPDASQQRKPPHAVQDPQEQDEERLFLESMRKMRTDFGPDFDRREGNTAEKRSSSSRIKQLKRGAIRIGAELDLHGFQKDEALFRLDHFIKSSVARGLRAVLVITGKGINSPEGPVLHGAVMEWLRKQGRGQVAELATAPRDKGGSGAIVVFLKNGKNT